MANILWGLLGLVLGIVGVKLLGLWLKGIFEPHEEMIKRLSNEQATTYRIASWLLVLPTLGLLAFGSYLLYQDGKMLLKDDKTWVEETIVQRMEEKDGVRPTSIELKKSGTDCTKDMSFTEERG